MFKFALFIFIILSSSITLAEPLKDQDLKQVQLLFGNIKELKCCHLLNKKEKAPFSGFLLKPYQLVFIKDTLDSWQKDLTFRLDQADSICQEKINLCQENRTLILDETKKETIYYSKLSEDLTTKLIDVKSNYKLFKIVTFITVPLAITLSVYIKHKI